MKHKIKKKIKKWDKLFQKQTIVNNQHINIIFLGITFLTLALVQIITSAYSNTLEALPTWIYLVSQGTLILILLSIFVFILILNFGKIWKFFLSLTFFGIYIALILNFSFLIPKSYIIYEFTCSDNFFNEINLSIKNEGRIISRNNILIKVSNPQTKLYYNSKPFRGGMTVLTFPGETRNDVINFGESKLINETIKIENIISCSSNFNCRTTASGKSEDECEYFCEKGICQRLK